VGQYLGQHFLTNPDVVRDILLASEIEKNENVLEIGPGTGVLTEALLGAGAHVIAVEKDIQLIRYLETRFPNEIISGQLKLVAGDVLHLPFNIYDLTFKIVANIPYYITGKFLRMIFEQEHLPEKVVLLIQREVAERIVVKDGKESILSISIKAYGEPSIVRYVPQDNFEPVPDVDSAVLLIGSISRQFFTAVKPLRKIDEQKFFDLVKRGFAHKRKKLSRNLEIEGLGNKRAEELSLNDWRELYLLSTLN